MLFLLNSVVVTIANLIVGLLIYFRNPRSKPHRLFLWMAVFIGLWITTLYVYYTSHIQQVVLWIGRFNFAAPTLAVYFMFRFAQEFPKNIHTIPRFFDRIITYFVWIMAVLAATTPLIDKYEHIIGSGRGMEFGVLYPLWVMMLFILLFASFYFIFDKLRQSKGVEKTQLQYLFFAFSLSFGFSVFTNVIMPFIFKSHELEPYGPAGGIVLTGITAYAIAKHRLLDVTSMVVRAVTYALLLVTIVAIEAFLVAISAKILPTDIDPVYVAAFGAIVIVLGYDVLRSELSKFTERIFFQVRYNTEDVLAKLTHTMATTIDIKSLSRQLLHILMEDLKVAYGSFVLYHEEGRSHIESVNWINSVRLNNINWDQELGGTQASYIFEEMEDEKLKSFFREQDIVAAFRLSIKNKEIGLLLLGPKASGEIYSSQDLELLSIFAPQAAVALNNARAYQEIQQFSRTLEKRVEERTEELKLSQKERLARANELLRIKDEFVFIATHDLATPVTALRGYVEMLRNEAKKLPKVVKEDVDAIGEATERLKALVEDLLQVARGESGTIKVELAETNLDEEIKQAVEIVAQRARDKKVKFELHLDKKASKIMADERKLHEVLENLFTNAVKYNKEKGSVVVSTKREGDKIILTVADTGIGIPETEQLKVFSKFYRSDNREVRNQTGTGLGLFVVKMLVTKMKGTIEFESKEGEGTTFTLTFNKA